MTEYSLHITLTELCQHAGTTETTIIEFVEHGILEPIGEEQTQWLFNVDTLQITRQAIRLHHDLGLNWAGVALALELISQREQLQLENQNLKQRLQRFLIEE